MGIKTLIFIILICHYKFTHVSSEDHYELKSITEPVIHGEGPHWDVDKQILYYVDMVNQTVNTYDPKTKKMNQVYFAGKDQVTLVIPVKLEDDELIIGRGRDLVQVKWDGITPLPSRTKVLATVDHDKPQNRFNDGKVDSSGRLWAGTIGPETPKLLLNQATLYSFEPYDSFRPKVQLTPVSVSNGIAWNNKDTLMYYNDSPTREVAVFDFDLLEGKISNRRTLFKLDDYNITGVPDGMCIDENDNIWTAIYRGGVILHIDTNTGKLIKKIPLPVTYVTSCAFGGSEFEHLYITTSKRDVSEKDLKKQPKAGSVFQLSNIGVKGQNKSNKIRIF